VKGPSTGLRIIWKLSICVWVGWINRRYKDTRIQGYKDTRIQGYKAGWFREYPRQAIKG